MQSLRIPRTRSSRLQSLRSNNITMNWPMRKSLLTSVVQTSPLSCLLPPEIFMRDAIINLRVLPEQLDLIDQAAGELSKSRSDFMLEAACERAQSVLSDQVYFRLEAKSFRQFAALLDAPVAPNPGIERLMAVKRPWQSGK